MPKVMPVPSAAQQGFCHCFLRSAGRFARRILPLPGVYKNNSCLSSDIVSQRFPDSALTKRKAASPKQGRRRKIAFCSAVGVVFASSSDTNRIAFVYAVGVHREGHVVQGVGVGAGQLCNLHQLFRVGFSTPRSASVVGRPTSVQNSQHLFQLLQRGILQHQLNQRAEGHLLAVVQAVGLRDGGQAVVDGIAPARPPLSKPTPDR